MLRIEAVRRRPRSDSGELEKLPTGWPDIRFSPDPAHDIRLVVGPLGSTTYSRTSVKSA
jgi:hypothetical protein